MRRPVTLLLLGLLVCGVALQPTRAGKKKVKAFTSRIESSFTNDTGQPAYGLHVVFSAPALLILDDPGETKVRFSTIKGNGSTKLRLSDAVEPVPAAEALELVFGTHNQKVRIKQWWWTDVGGKRLGSKDRQQAQKQQARQQKQEEERRKKEQKRLDKQRRREAKQQQKQETQG